MLQLESGSKAYGSQELFSKVSVRLNKGERCGLVGRNGHGKSTLLRIFSGLEELDEGDVSFPKGYRLGYLKQNSSFSHETAFEEVESALCEEDLGATYLVEKFLFGLGFTEEMARGPLSALSGGYHLRIQLAKVLVSKPDLLLLDEPTNYLDIVSIQWLTRFLLSWRGEMILVTHDRGFMDKVCTHTMGIHRAKIRKVKGNTEHYYEQLLAEEEIHERTRMNLEKKRANLEHFIRRFGAKSTKATQAQSKAKALQKMGTMERLANVQSLDFEFQEAEFPGKWMLRVNNLEFSYDDQDDQDRMIRDVAFELQPGDRMAVVGKNGRGKSTLLKLFAKELKQLKGSIHWSDNVKVGYFGQTNIERLNESWTVEEEISSANPDLSLTEVRGLCGLMMFPGDHSTKPVSVLSGGERSRVLLGKILASPTNVLLLDEPTNHLDMESVEALVQALQSFRGAVILVTHSEYILQNLSERFIICRQSGQELFEGDYQDFLDKKGWEDGEQASNKKNSSKRKDERRKRAEYVQQRAKVLGPIKKEIERLERQIEKDEQSLALANTEMINISLEGNSQKIQDFGKKLASLQKVVEGLYEDLERVMLKYEEESQRLDSEK